MECAYQELRYGGLSVFSSFSSKSTLNLALADCCMMGLVVLVVQVQRKVHARQEALVSTYSCMEFYFVLVMPAIYHIFNGTPQSRGTSFQKACDRRVFACNPRRTLKN